MIHSLHSKVFAREAKIIAEDSDEEIEKKSTEFNISNLSSQKSSVLSNLQNPQIYSDSEIDEEMNDFKKRKNRLLLSHHGNLKEEKLTRILN